MKMAVRERRVLIWGGCFLGALLVFQLFFYPALKRNRELERLIPQKERDLRELLMLGKGLESLKERRMILAQKIPAAEKNLSPLSRLDGLIERAGLRQNIRSIKPFPSTGPGIETITVEVLMEKAELPQLTRFLYEVQSSPGGFGIARMTVKPRYTTPRYLDINIQMVFYPG